MRAQWAAVASAMALSGCDTGPLADPAHAEARAMIQAEASEGVALRFRGLTSRPAGRVCGEVAPEGGAYHRFMVDVDRERTWLEPGPPDPDTYPAATLDTLAMVEAETFDLAWQRVCEG